MRERDELEKTWENRVALSVRQVTVLRYIVIWRL